MSAARFSGCRRGGRSGLGRDSFVDLLDRGADLLDGFTNLLNRAQGLLAVDLRISLISLDLVLELVHLFADLLGLGNEVSKLVLDSAQVLGVANAPHSEIRERENRKHAEGATDEDEDIQSRQHKPKRKSEISRSWPRAPIVPVTLGDREYSGVDARCLTPHGQAAASLITLASSAVGPFGISA